MTDTGKQRARPMTADEIRSMTAEEAEARTSWGAPLTCPSCGDEFKATWVARRTGNQQCPACGHVFEATWPGFTFEPETIIVAAPGHRIRIGPRLPGDVARCSCGWSGHAYQDHASKAGSYR